MPTRSITATHLRPLDSPESIEIMIAAWQTHRDERARDAVFNQFAPLARRLARRYRTPHEPFDDLLQVAFVGLLGAIERFDPSRGCSFGSFAIPTILGELKKYFRNTGWAVHVPRGHQEMALHIDHAIREIVARTGRTPGIRELAEYLEVDTEDVLAGLDAGNAHYAISLDAPLAPAEPDEPDRLIDTMGHNDEGYALAETTISLATAISRLPHCERQALSLRLERDLKQTEIAEVLGCSQMQVSRLLRRAAIRLREMTALPDETARRRRRSHFPATPPGAGDARTDTSA
jgi:RNA polymerase sigma-B factor